MASSYTTRLRLEKPGIGEQDGTWGGTANTDFDLIDASFGSASITHDDTANYSLTTNNGSADEARAFVYVIGGTLTAARNVIVPTASKVFIAHNNTSGGYAITVKTSGGSGVSVANGKKKLLYCDGTDVVDAATVVGNANLEAIAALAVTDGNIIVGDGSTWVAESGATARTSLGAGDTNGPGSATDNAVARFDGTGGKTLQNSVVTIADGGDLTAAGTGATAWLVQGTGGTVTHCLDRTDTHGDNVLVGTLEFRGRDSGGANQAYGFIDARCVLDDAGAETGALEFRIGNAGTATQRLYIRTGIYTPNATGGDKGADTINASAIYDDGVQIVIPKIAIYQNQQTSGTAGPSFTSGSFQKYPLNTVVVDDDGIGALSSDQITVDAGTYEIKARLAIRGTTGPGAIFWRARLYNATNTSVLIQGENTGMYSGSPSIAHVEGVFTFAAQTAIEAQIECSSNSGSISAMSTGENEVYATVIVKKIA